ncbi:MAG: hypothetical protein AAGB11_06495 [Pseudomonadota bacterium]
MPDGVATTLKSSEQPPIGVGEAPPSPVWQALGGLDRDVHLIRADTFRDTAMGAGFVLSALAKLKADGLFVWVSQKYLSCEAGHLYGPGLKNYGLDPQNILFVEASALKDVFWSVEEALGSGSVAAVVGEVHTAKSLDLTPTRRLALRSRRAGVPVFLMAANSAPFASAARTHWLVAGMERLRGGHPHPWMRPPAWSLTLTKNKNGPCGTASVGFDVRNKAYFAPGAMDALPSRSTLKPLVSGGIGLASGMGGALEPVVVRLAAERRLALEQRRERQ